MFCSSDQHTALHLAARNGHTAVCELLIAGKTDVNAKSRCSFIKFAIDFVLYFDFELCL